MGCRLVGGLKIEPFTGLSSSISTLSIYNEAVICTSTELTMKALAGEKAKQRCTNSIALLQLCHVAAAARRVLAPGRSVFLDGSAGFSRCCRGPPSRCCSAEPPPRCPRGPGTPSRPTSTVRGLPSCRHPRPRAACALPLALLSPTCHIPAGCHGRLQAAAEPLVPSAHAGANYSGEWNDAALQTLAKQPFVVFEKYQCAL